MPVEEALRRVLDSAGSGTEAIRLPIAECDGLTLAEPLTATRTQPPFDASAMDGYAARSADIAIIPAALKLIGESAAGRRFAGALRPGECVRIFTGAPVPAGADVVVLQEDTERDGDAVTVREAVAAGRHIRKAGIDFSQGDLLIEAGTRLSAKELALAAAMNHAELPVRRRPRVGLLATGDELVMPGAQPGPDQIISSNSFAVAALVRKAGGEPFDLGITADTLASLERAFARAADLQLDVLVTLGGASVGDHDLVQAALRNEGLTLDFWRIAMRPGKPMMFGRFGEQRGGLRILGLPGNPVASYVCSLMFLTPLLRALVGDPGAGADASVPAVLGAAVTANDKRQDYLRARAERREDGVPVVTPYPVQDSSMLSVLAKADALLLREPFAPAADKGQSCRIIWL